MPDPRILESRLCPEGSGRRVRITVSTDQGSAHPADRRRRRRDDDDLFPEVRPAFDRVKDGDPVALTTWRGRIVAVTAEGDRETTSDAPSARFRSRLTGTFYAAALTLVLAGASAISATAAGWFFVGSRRKPALRGAAVAILGGIIVAFTGAQLNEGMSISGDIGVGAGAFVVAVGLGAVFVRTISSGEDGSR